MLVCRLAEGEDSGQYTCTVSALNTIHLTHTVRVRGECTQTVQQTANLANFTQKIFAEGLTKS